MNIQVFGSTIDNERNLRSDNPKNLVDNDLTQLIRKLAERDIMKRLENWSAELELQNQKTFISLKRKL